MKVLSLGWGRQSFALAVMCANGDFERPDVLLHADTTHENSGTYKTAETWTPWFTLRGLRVVTVKPDAKKTEAFDQWRGVYIPAFTASKNGDGQLNRQCTGNWKIAPMRRWLQANRNSENVEMWIGISLDEFQRMKDSPVKYITHRYPLVELKMTVADCIKYLTQHGYDIPPRSSCVFCPYHNFEEWRQIQRSPEDWAHAVAHDEAIRKIRPPFDLFVHPSRRPLSEIDFRNEEDRGQINLWDNECEGLCGV